MKRTMKVLLLLRLNLFSQKDIKSKLMAEIFDYLFIVTKACYINW